MEGKEPKRILVLGSAVIDVIIDIARLPKAGARYPGHPERHDCRRLCVQRI